MRIAGIRVRAAAALCLTVLGALRADVLDTARAALQDGLYAVAQRHAEQALRSGTGAHAEAELILLEALAGQGRYDELLRRLDGMRGDGRTGAAAEAYAYWRALALLNTGDPAAAAAVSDAAKTNAVSFAAALRRVGARARLATGDTAGALALFAEADKSTTNVQVRAENALEWALALDGTGDAEAALQVLKMQAELGISEPVANDGALLRGRILMRLGRAAEATMVFNQLAMNERASEAARVQALVEMSVYTFNSGKTNEAIAYARSAYERAQAPETRRLAGFRLGDLLSSAPETIDEAGTLIKGLVRESPEQIVSMQAQLKLADALLQAKRSERAASEYRIFLETYPSSSMDAEVLQGRGWALFQMGRYTESSGAFQRAAELATNVLVKAECLFKQADALLADGRYAESAEVYARVPEAFPQSPLADRALYQSAESLERAGLRAEAEARYRQVAERFASRDVAPRALLRLAALQAESSAFDSAIETYTTIISSFAQKAVRSDALMGRGKVQYRTFRFDAAMQDFATVAESDPSRKDEARYLLTLCLYGLGRDKEARAAAAAYLLDFPESARLPDMILWLGKFDFNRGRFADARRFFLDYVSRWPANAWADAALLWAARAAFGDRDFTGAVEAVTRLVREYPQSARLAEARLLQADALMELARFDEAVLLLEQVIAQAPDSDWAGQARLRKGDCLFTLGADNSQRYQDALTVYRELLQQPGLTATAAMQLRFKIGRCLEKMKRLDEAIDQYYAEVMIRYQEDRAKGVWFDETCSSLFVRAAFNIAELYEQMGQPTQAIGVLQRALQSGVPGAEEARQRIERLRKKRK